MTKFWFKILISLLDNLVKKLGKDDFEYLSQEFNKNVSDLVKQKAFHPYEHMSFFKKCKKEVCKFKKI